MLSVGDFRGHGLEYPAETVEAFCDGHVEAFAFFGGVPLSILYDNTALAVAKILGDGTRQRSRLFAALQSHHLFEDHFERPGKGNDKGKVEGMVGYGRRAFMVPMPRARDFAEPPQYERETLHFPASLITEYRDDGSYETVMAKRMDFL